MKTGMNVLVGVVGAALSLGSMHCSASDEAASDDDQGALLDGVLSPYVTPDPNNPWTKGVDLASYALGQENVLPDEDARFANLVTRVTALQDTLMTQRNGGTKLRGFHAKSHACVDGELTLFPPASIPAVGLFAPENVSSPHKTLVRLSNGVGFREADAKIDVRGVAFKISDVQGAALPGSPPGIQDILFTNGPNTPAPHAEHFVDFMEASVKAELDSGGKVFESLQSFLRLAPFLLEPRNERVRRNLETHIVTSVLKNGSLYGEHFWTGGALATGLAEGDAMSAPARGAMKLNAVAGAPVTNPDGTTSCRPYSKLPDLPDADYFRHDVVGRLKSAGMCFELRAQLQRDAQGQPLEDTSVEWQEKDAPSVAVGVIMVPAVDLSSQDAQAREADCNARSFTPWNGLRDHRPLGNIMRVRRIVYGTSAKARGAQ